MAKPEDKAQKAAGGARFHASDAGKIEHVDDHTGRGEFEAKKKGQISDVRVGNSPTKRATTTPAERVVYGCLIASVLLGALRYGAKMTVHLTEGIEIVGPAAVVLGIVGVIGFFWTRGKK